jgi:repressor of nif and glnA expression
MATDLDRRAYDLLRLIDGNGPIGSIRLVDLMQQRGYSIKGRTIRLLLSDLDEAGLTTKVPGKGRRLTDAGRHELRRGDVTGRLQQIRERISVLTSQVTYDPTEHAGELVTCVGYVAPENADRVFDLLERLSSSRLGPVLVAADRDDERLRLAFPSSITLDGILLSHGISVDLLTAGLVEYVPGNDGITRYVDTLSGEGSTMDAVSLLIEADRTDVTPVLDDETGLLIVDAREFPLPRFAEGRDLSVATQERLGGVVDIARPRGAGPFPTGEPGWEFASLTYAGVGETALALLYEQSLLEAWESLAGPRPASVFEPVSVVRAAFTGDGRTAE